MKIAIMQPYFMPYIGYFQLINAVDKFVVLDDVNYINKGWINRNNILLNGKPHLFTIPLEGASQNKKIGDIKVSTEHKWKEKLLKQIELNYKKAPFFSAGFSLFEKTIHSGYQKIAELNCNAIKMICEYLGITTTIVSSGSGYNNQHLKGQERILDICRQEQANNYINPIGGTELYDKTLFLSKGIQLNFLKTLPITYKQFNNEFVPWLSMIDVLMFNSAEEVKLMLNVYSLV